MSSNNTGFALKSLDAVTCVAEYVLPSSPSPSPAPLPKLALVSNFPPNYSGPSANLTATLTANGSLIECVKAPSPILGSGNVSNVTIVSPGAGLCGVDGSMPAGNYSLSQVAPPGVRFNGWACSKVMGNTSTLIGTDPSVLLQSGDAVTCEANFVLVDSTCGDTVPAAPGAQQYNCSRATMAFNSSAAMMGPASDSVCCLPTCSDRNVSSPAPKKWGCPANSSFDESMVMSSPPTDQLCCYTGPAFTADKTGPPLVKPGDTFNDTIDVVFVHATTGVTITDDLPAGLVPGSAAATWTATSSVADNPKSGSCVTTASAKPEFVCNLGANVTWAKGDSVRVTVPIVAALNATGNLTNVASVVDLKNNTAGDSKTTQICTKCLPPTDCFDAVKSGPTTVQAGSGFEFKISVLFSCKPSGPITITDTLPAGLQATSAPAIWRATYANGSTLASACITSGNSVTCSLNAEWGKSDKVEITVPVVASASAQGTVVNQATVTDGNRTVTPQAPVNVTKPDPSGPPFTVSKTGPSTVKAGEAFDYNVVVTFFGASTGVVMVDDLPPQVTAQQSKAGSWKAMTVNGANPSGVCTTTQVVPSGNDTTLRTRVTCDLGKNNTWATADRVEITLPVVAGASVTGTVSNTAKVTDDKDRLAEDNHAVIINPAQPVGSPFTITKTGPTQPVLAGQAFTYSIVVGFLGQTKGVKVTDVLPATVNASATPTTWISSKSSTSTPCVTNSAASPNTITCDLGTSTVWNAGDTVEISVPVVAGLSAAANTVNTATVTDDQNRTSSDTFPVTINVDPSSPFSITKTGPTQVTQGTPFLFEVNVVMLAPAKGVTIIDEMPPGLWPTGNASWTATSANRVPGGACTTTNRTGTTGDASYTCDLGAGISWARGDRIKMIVPSVATTALQTLVNRASVRDDQNRGANATAGVNADLPAPPNSLMNIIKSGPTTPVAVGQPFVFTIAATFDAAGPFTAARIVDDLPAGLLPNGNATWVAQNAAAAGGRLTGTCITTPATSPEFTFTAGVAGDESVNPLIIVDELQSADLKFVAPMPPNCVQNSDQKATCTWNEAVGPGDDKLLQFRVTANKTGTFQNKATVLTTVPGVANQTATAPVTVVPTNNPAPPISGISVLKKGPSQSGEAGKEPSFTLQD
ncbi:hypothetical protein OEZ85_009923 [Tetradesmus obliquus]|uniref:DUF11 domain-containing protein n=1 Tax=Tetradesmus obliquus TaxID=3088 RepID=A0ABY8UDM8_TETOB|nr:hypothetical protein OEZ85_009923 [Tetradesmus obliquus]